jgi:hypothetical protein
MKKIKIIKCNDTRKWYANKIGEFVPFIKEMYPDMLQTTIAVDYRSIDDSGFINFVAAEDCEIIDC